MFGLSARLVLDGVIVYESMGICVVFVLCRFCFWGSMNCALLRIFVLDSINALDSQFVLNVPCLDLESS